MASQATNDGVSVGQFSLCSTGLYNRITLHSPQIWKALVETRWRKNSHTKRDDYLYEQDVFLRDNQYNRWEYLRRQEMDQTILVARCLQNLHFAECLHQWKEISEFQERSTEDPNVINAIVLERYALLVGEIQQSPPDLLLARNDDESITQVVV